MANVTVSSASTPVPEAAGGTGTTTGYYGFKNRIINGAMTISQRGTSFTNPGSFTTDRWDVYNYIGTTVASQSSTAPAGFVNSLLITNGTAASPSATFNYQISQCIEGFNIADLAWGTANAKSVTVSFWVQSSLTGTFGFALTNGGAGGSNSPTLPTRSYVTTYTISSANTWTYITITIAGDTSGTWNTNNSNGICVIYELGSGSNFQTSTTNAWQAGNYAKTSSTVNLNATTGATFYVTGVQLEKGSTATSFDYRPYTTELALAQRYFISLTNATISSPMGVGYQQAALTTSIIVTCLPVSMRTSPTATFQNLYITDNTSHSEVCSSIQTVGVGGNLVIYTGWVHSSGGTAFRPCSLQAQNGTAGNCYLNFSAEL
jgi:hypothetical protein